MGRPTIGCGHLPLNLRSNNSHQAFTHSEVAPPRQEAALQGFLGDRLAARGATVTIEEPDAALVAGHPMVSTGLSFAGRSQLVARFGG